MAWSGSWDSTNTVFTGTFTDEDGSTFTGTWTAPLPQSGGATVPASEPPSPPTSDDDVYTQGEGPRSDDSDSTERDEAEPHQEIDEEKEDRSTEKEESTTRSANANGARPGAARVLR